MVLKKILIVGGTGFIGHHLAKFLIKKNFSITSMSRKPPISNERIKKVKYVYININNPKELKKLNTNFDVVVNLSGYIDHSNKVMTHRTHYKGCINLYNKFNKTNIDKFIQIGSSLEYGNMSSPHNEKKKINLKLKSSYSSSKLLATKFLIKKFNETKFPAIIIRPYQIYGPRQKNNRMIPFVIQNCLKNNSFECSQGIQLRDFLYIDDFVKAIYKIIKKKNLVGEIINIGYGKPEKVKNVISYICKIIKRGKPKFGEIKLRPDETKIFYPSINKAKNILNWKPKIKLKTGLRRTINDYKK